MGYSSTPDVKLLRVVSFKPDWDICYWSKRAFASPKEDIRLVVSRSKRCNATKRLHLWRIMSTYKTHRVVIQEMQCECCKLAPYFRRELSAYGHHPTAPLQGTYVRYTYSERLTYEDVLPHPRYHHQPPLIRGPPEPVEVYRDTVVKW